MRFTTFSILIVALAVACAKQPHPPLPATTLAPQPPPRAEEDDLPIGRLPSDARPRNYVMHLAIDPARTTFSGDVAIAVSLNRATDHVWLHGQGLRMKQTQATLADGRVIVTHWQQMTPFGLARLDFGETIAAQEVRLLFSYDADFDKTRDGLYRVVADGDPYIFAQFEAVAARRCFPSFDEPRFKTPFDIAVTAPKDAKVVATTRIVSASASELPAEFRLGELPKDMVRTRFATTAPLPTYLLTFAVGPLDVVDNGPLAVNDVRRTPLPFRGIAARGQGKKLEQAMRVTRPLLAALEKYFGIAYPFDKLDILAVPGFAGGMENAGAITFSDGLLLADSATITARQRRDMTNVLAHELAHMWFGDTVTMQWWDDLWLNEAFATWMQRRIVQQVDPTIEAELGGVDAVLRAMDTDALVSARQIHQPVSTTNEISNAFDTITYNKGMGVLAMVEKYAGADKLRDAIRAYMRDYQFANATADDFFAHLDAASPDASRILRSFIDQAGVPQVDAELTCNASAPASLTLAQQRYLPIGSTGDTESRWVIPVCARYVIGKDRVDQCWVLDAPKATVTLSKPGCPTWLTPNVDGLGYYRYAMSPTPMNALLTAMNAGQLSRSEEIALFQTLRASIRAGRTPPAELFKSLPSFVARADEKLDAAVIGLLIDVQSQLVDPATAKAVDDFMQTTFAKRIGKEPFLAQGKETDDEKLSRTSIATLLSVELDDAPQRRAAGKHGSAVLTAIEEGKPVTTVDPQLVGTVLAVYTDEGGEKVHHRVVAALEKQNDPSLRRELVSALAGVRTNENVRRTLSTLLTPVIRTNEIWSAMWPMARRKTSRQQTWDWLRENFAALRDRVPNEDQGYLIALGRFFCSPEGERELEEFFGPRVASLMGGAQIYAEARESVQLCAARAAALGEPVRQYFMGDDITRRKTSL